MSSRPNAFSISSAALVTPFWSVTSSLTRNTFGTFRFAAVAASTVAVSVAVRSERAPMAMLSAPAFAKKMAIARPIPLEAPQMKTFFPLRLARVELMVGYASL